MMDASPQEQTPIPKSQKAVTQERILRVAMELFAQRGFHRTSMSMIASRASLSRSAIFWHFGDKETLFRETCRHFLVPFRRSIERPPTHNDPRAVIAEQIESYTRFLDANSHLIHAFLSWVFSAPEQARWLREELLALHAAFVRELESAFGRLMDDPKGASFAAACVASLLHGNMVLTLGDAPPNRRVDPAKLAGQLVDVLLAAR